MTTTVDVDDKLVLALVREIERLAEWTGWDQPAQLYVLYDSHDHTTEQAYHHLMRNFSPSPVRRGRYAARNMVPTDVLNLGGSPTHNLFRLALNLGYSEDERAQSMVDAMAQPGFLGVAFLCEAWARSYADKDERAAESQRPFADIPGSKEIRNVMATTVNGVDLYVSRERGSKPFDGDFTNLGGSIIECLRVITAKIGGLPLPEGVTTPFRWEWPETAEAGTP